MKQTLLTLCLIVFALPSLGQTTFSGGSISGGKIGNNSSSSNQQNNLVSSDLEKGVMYQLSSEYFIKQEPKKLFSFFPHQYSNISENHHLVISVYGSEDLSNDGINEIFGAIYVFDENDEYHTSNKAKPFILEWNSDTNQLQTSHRWKNIFPKMTFPRRFETFKNKQNGTTDIFIADYGVDGFSPKHPNCGAQNRWFQINGNNITEKTEELPNINDMTHDLVVEDLNQDGLADLVALNDPIPNKQKCTGLRLEEKSYILLSSKSGFKKFYFDEIGIEKHLYLAGEAQLNSNNGFHLILSRDGSHTKGGIDIYNFEMKNSNLKINYNETFSLNNENLGAEIRKGDIDNDGVDEFVISNSASKDWRGNKLFIASNKKGKWILSRLFYEENLHGNLGKKDRGWCERIFLIDIDKNSMIDYICTNRTKANQLKRIPVIFNNKEKYQGVKLMNNKFRQFFPLMMPEQLDNLLVGTKYGRATSKDVMIEWQFFGYKIPKHTP